MKVKFTAYFTEYLLKNIDSRDFKLEKFINLIIIYSEITNQWYMKI